MSVSIHFNVQLGYRLYIGMRMDDGRVSVDRLYAIDCRPMYYVSTPLPHHSHIADDGPVFGRSPMHDG